MVVEMRREQMPLDSAISELNRSERVVAMKQMLRLNVPHQIRGCMREVELFSDMVGLTPNWPMTSTELAAITPNTTADGLFSLAKPNGVSTAVVWNLREAMMGTKIEFEGVLIQSFPGHVIVTGERPVVIKVPADKVLDSEAELTFRGVFNDLARTAPGTFLISPFNLNPKLRELLPAYKKRKQV